MEKEGYRPAAQPPIIMIEPALPLLSVSLIVEHPQVTAHFHVGANVQL